LKELEKYAFAKSLGELELDHLTTIGYTYKAMGAALFCLEHYDNFEEAITDVTFEAGDADSNCAVAGALMGAKVGFKGLNPRWVEELANKEFLDKRVDSVLQLLGLNE
jgi:ADP-ribosylglycohydrolase